MASTPSIQSDSLLRTALYSPIETLLADQTTANDKMIAPA